MACAQPKIGILLMIERVTELAIERPVRLIHVRCAYRDGKVTTFRLGTSLLSASTSRRRSRIEGFSRVGPQDAMIPAIAGQASIAGSCQIGLDPSDPHPKGFTLTNTWVETV